jgi:hypothetical protein
MSLSHPPPPARYRWAIDHRRLPLLALEVERGDAHLCAVASGGDINFHEVDNAIIVDCGRSIHADVWKGGAGLCLQVGCSPEAAASPSVETSMLCSFSGGPTLFPRTRMILYMSDGVARPRKE